MALRPAKDKRTTHSTRHPALPQELPADQRTPEGEERLVDLCPLVVADAEAAELVEPRKRPLNDPAPLPLEPVTKPPAKAAAATRFGHVLRQMVNASY